MSTSTEVMCVHCVQPVMEDRNCMVLDCGHRFHSKCQNKYSIETGSLSLNECLLCNSSTNETSNVDLVMHRRPLTEPPPLPHSRAPSVPPRLRNFQEVTAIVDGEVQEISEIRNRNNVQSPHPPVAKPNQKPTVPPRNRSAIPQRRYPPTQPRNPITNQAQRPVNTNPRPPAPVNRSTPPRNQTLVNMKPQQPNRSQNPQNMPSRTRSQAPSKNIPAQRPPLRRDQAPPNVNPRQGLPQQPMPPRNAVPPNMYYQQGPFPLQNGQPYMPYMNPQQQMHPNMPALVLTPNGAFTPVSLYPYPPPNPNLAPIRAQHQPNQASPRARSQSQAPQSKPCYRYGNCKNAACPKDHPEKCRFDEKCKNDKCTRWHPNRNNSEPDVYPS